MVDIGETLSQLNPQWNFSGVVSTIAWGIIIMLILIGISVGAYIIIQKKKYKYKIVIFEKINNSLEDTGKDVACEIPLNKGGDSVFYLKKRRKFIPIPRLQSGRRKYYFYIREDGEMINFRLPDIDEKMKQSEVHYLDKEMRYARTQLQKALKDRYETKNVWKEYAPIIISVMFIAMIGVFAWLLFDKWLDLAETTNAGVKISGEVMQQAKEILASLDNIKSGGSGMIPQGNP